MDNNMIWMDGNMNSNFGQPDWISIKSWLPGLTDKNFIAVCDVVLDIKQQFQLSDEATIDLQVPIDRGELQIPAAVDLVDITDYSSQLRWEAAKKLYKERIVSNLTVIEGNRQRPIRFCVKVNITIFNYFADLINKELERRGEVNAANGKKYHRVPRRGNPWLAGSFYLFSVVTILASLAIVSKFLPLWMPPFVFAGTVLLAIVVGAMQLRHDAALGDNIFARLILETIRRVLSLARLILQTIKRMLFLKG